MDRTLDAAIAELAATQHSAFARHQARSLGFTNRQIEHRREAGRWSTVRPHVFTPAGTAPTFRTDVMAAVLWGGPGAVASHRTAGELFDIAGLRSRSPIDITVPRGRHPRTSDVRTHRSLLLGTPDVTTLDGIPVTRPVRSLIDSGHLVTAAELEIATDTVFHRGWATPESVIRHLERLRAPLRIGSKPLVELLLARDPSWAPLESVLETMVWQLIADSGLILPERQYEVVVAGKRFRIDMCYPPPIALAIEPSGFRWHCGRLKWGMDKRREALLVSAGYSVLPVTHGDVTRDAVATLAVIRNAVEIRMAR